MKHEEVVKTLREIHKKIKLPKGYKKRLCTLRYGASITIFQAKGEVIPGYWDEETDGEVEENVSHEIAATIELTRAHAIIGLWQHEPKSFKVKLDDPNLNTKIQEVLVSACKMSDSRL